MLKLNLEGKTAIVTGGAGELGRVMVRTLARCEANVAIHYFTNKSMAEEILGEIRAMGVNGMIVQADITNLDAILRMRDAVAAELGHPDIVVTNAVAQYNWTTVLEQAAEDYESQFRSCVLQNVFMAKAFVPAMIEKKTGRIIALNTECAMQCHPNQSAYVSGKRGMDGVLRVLAREIGEHGITVNQVAPGWMISDRYRSTGTERQEEYEQGIPLRHRGQDQDIANMIAFLASDLAGFVSGAYIPVSGGNVMPCI